jgi:multidrug efflux pump subunit AcrB
LAGRCPAASTRFRHAPARKRISADPPGEARKTDAANEGIGSMAVNISAWSIRHPLPPIVLAVAMMVMGLIAFGRLPITRMPNVDAPVISVTVVQFGSSPTELETQVTKLIEDAVSSVTGAHHINSLITDGISNTTIIFRLETDTDRAINDVKDAIARVRVDLPRGIDEPIVQRVEIAGLPILTYAAIAPGKTPEQLSWFVQDVVVRGLQGVRGVGQRRTHRQRRSRNPGRT